jgi:hypothetical protein
LLLEDPEGEEPCRRPIFSCPGIRTRTQIFIFLSLLVFWQEADVTGRLAEKNSKEGRFSKQWGRSQVWWCTPVIPALGSLREED